MTALMIDECMSPRLPPLFAENGIYAVHIRDRDMLGVLDSTVWRYAQQFRLIVCTINGRDFIDMAREAAHCGVLVIPGGGNLKRQYDWIMCALMHAARLNTGPGMANRYIEVDANGSMIQFEEYEPPHLY